MSSKDLAVGDRVEWNTPQGKTTGRVKKKLTGETRIKSHKVAASPENPEYLVETEKTKKLAAHNPRSFKSWRTR